MGCTERHKNLSEVVGQDMGRYWDFTVGVRDFMGNEERDLVMVGKFRDILGCLGPTVMHMYLPADSTLALDDVDVPLLGTSAWPWSPPGCSCTQGQLE
jgi:hypothetical protein